MSSKDSFLSRLTIAAIFTTIIRLQLDLLFLITVADPESFKGKAGVVMGVRGLVF
jgi:hypothetical protein